MRRLISSFIFFLVYLNVDMKSEILHIKTDFNLAMSKFSSIKNNPWNHSCFILSVRARRTLIHFILDVAKVLMALRRQYQIYDALPQGYKPQSPSLLDKIFALKISRTKNQKISFVQTLQYLLQEIETVI